MKNVLTNKRASVSMFMRQTVDSCHFYMYGTEIDKPRLIYYMLLLYALKNNGTMPRKLEAHGIINKENATVYCMVVLKFTFI